MADSGASMSPVSSSPPTSDPGQSPSPVLGPAASPSQTCPTPTSMKHRQDSPSHSSASESSSSQPGSSSAPPDASPRREHDPPHPQQEQRQHVQALEAQLLKFKRLLTMSRERLEENQRHLGEKTQTIDRLSKEVESTRQQWRQTEAIAASKAQAAIEATTALKELQQQLNQQQQEMKDVEREAKHGKGGSIRRKLAPDKQGKQSPKPTLPAYPRRSLLYVEHGGTHWVLFDYHDPVSHKSGAQNQENGCPSPSPSSAVWRAFPAKSDLDAFLLQVPGSEPLLLPAPCLPAAQASLLQAQAQAQVEKALEALRCGDDDRRTFLPPSLPPHPDPRSFPPHSRKYRVRTELAVRQKDMEIQQLSAQLLASQQDRIQHQGPTEEELRRTLKAQADTLQALRAELRDQEEKWKGQYERLRKEKAGLEAAGAETGLALQWRRRYEELLQEREREGKREGGGHRMSFSGSGPVEEKYTELKEEYRLYRKKALEALREKDNLIATLDGEGERRGERRGGEGRWAGGRDVGVLEELDRKVF
ncbi:hypothetical protein NSK_004530 [Nannochloropsis salina CCMP1776]|uniref:Uncharacterized protein n=1 Tax=Nannochloropsis salina CCMP1776 TaxID=1027361 RepID=A0A4D9CYG5_9STRA|nr:hypothetical protein NSK_004530 [Nannochloropsis salina CCMP1776]|eukprot:TFJ84056.1 hypothetical protein NSK_004530 [Nannochloropsis salina CCMP1776]